MNDHYPYYVANQPATGPDLLILDKYTGKDAASVSQAEPEAIDRALTAAVTAKTACRNMPSYARAAVLHRVAARLTERSHDFAHVLAVEAGKPIRDARAEVVRAIDTFRIAAEEATRIGGEYMPLDVSPRSEGCEAIWKRVPVGVCSFIAPFNFPLNLAAHKVAPAIAAGCPWILKPSSRTPITAIMLGEILAETDLPPGAFSILPCTRHGADMFTTDERANLLSFTGSPDVGWNLKSKAGRKKVILELGGNAACIVDSGADLDYAAQRLLIGAFYQSGQSCISVQRIFVHKSIYAPLRDKLVTGASVLKSGNPLSEDTFIGPMISENDARRIETWVATALSRGATLLCGGHRDGAIYKATLLENVPDDAEISCKEAFGPVAILEPFDSFEAVCRRVNASDYGLQAGLFTKNIDHAFYAWNELEVGGIVVNDVPAFRVDCMPYGGVKASGLGREGVRFAIEEMTELRLLVLNKVGRITT